MKAQNLTLKESDIDLIDQYVSGTLSQENKTQFEERLQTDSNFSKQYTFVKSITSSLDEIGKNENLEMLKSLEKEYFTDNNAPIPLNPPSKVKDNRIKPSDSWVKHSKFKYLGIAAIGLALLFVLPQLFTNPSKDIVINNFEPFPSHVIKRSVNQDLNQVKNDAYIYYGIEAYSQAIPLLEQLNNNGDQSVLIHLASAYIGISEYEKAQTIINQLNPNKEYSQNVLNWYQSLIHLGLNQQDKAKELLKTIQQESNPYQERAHKLLKQLQ